ncbi:MAG: molybdopterin dehydrogenase [Hyphomicrobiales bacterium]|nr:molybdopterin dehydrogenase [Hyphomicrobiales bacterium]
MTGIARTASPETIGETSAIVAGFTGSIAYIAGGTDLIIALEQGFRPDMIVDISRMEALNFVEINFKHVRIGAATPVSALTKLNELHKGIAALSQAAEQFGSAQIRNRATLGGNIASAKPAGDLLPVLMCLDCHIEVLCRDGSTKKLALDEVVTDSGTTSLDNGDLITAINLPLQLGDNPISAFGKIGRRRELTIARLNLTVLADYQTETSLARDIRIVAGAIGPVPLRLKCVEQELRGRKVDQTFADDFLGALTGAVDAAIPGRYSQTYKRQAVMGLGLDVLQSLFGREFSLPACLRGMT